jgi:hypothetical protein
MRHSLAALLLGACGLAGCGGATSGAAPDPQPTAGAPAPPGFTTAVTAEDPRIGTLGRVSGADGRLRFDWPGVSVVVTLDGPAIAFELEDPGRGNHVDVFVNGARTDVWRLRPGIHAYAVEGLGPGEHRVRLARRTEGLQGVTTLHRVFLPAQAALRAPPPRAARRLEIVGASWVAGYGNEGETYGSCADLEAVSNSWESFGAVTARRLGADYHIVAASSQGVVRNAGDPEPTSAVPFPAQYARLLWNDPASAWSFESFVPHGVVVDLGINDHTTDPRPPEHVFQAGYAAFLARLRGYYSRAHLFCVNVAGWPHFSHLVEEVVEDARRRGDRAVSFTAIPSFPLREMGCDQHPRVEGHHAIADVLTPVIAATLGWS